MATINYKCDACYREIELIENKNGLTSYGICTITNNCRGSLYSIKRNPNNVRQSVPEYHAGLDDYVSRKLLLKYEQSIPSDRWIVKHGFGVSCVYIVYNSNGVIVDADSYTTTNQNGKTVFYFNTPLSGSVHILTRTGGIENEIVKKKATVLTQVSYDGIVTFAVPRFITRIDSGSAPVLPPPNVALTPTPTPTSINPVPFDTRLTTIRIEVEVTKPNEQTVACIETLSDILSTKSPWSNWPSILVRKRRNYEVKTLDLTKLKVFSNTNNQKLIIPDGTIFKITRIDYGTGLLVNIPDRGLLILLSNPPYTTLDKNLTNVIDCGEMVNAYLPSFSFGDFSLFTDEDNVEDTYPKISKTTF